MKDADHTHVLSEEKQKPRTQKNRFTEQFVSKKLRQPETSAAARGASTMLLKKHVLKVGAKQCCLGTSHIRGYSVSAERR